jgi:hypothetical protein
VIAVAPDAVTIDAKITAMHEAMDAVLHLNGAPVAQAAVPRALRAPAELVPLIRYELIEGAEHYATAGKLLLEAKAGLKHGEWLPWLKTNFKLSQQTASVYMRLAEKQITGPTRSLEDAARTGRTRTSPRPTPAAQPLPATPQTPDPSTPQELDAEIAAKRAELAELMAAVDEMRAEQAALADLLAEMHQSRRRLKDLVKEQDAKLMDINRKLRERREQLRDVDAAIGRTQKPTTENRTHQRLGVEMLQAGFKTLAKARHPDVGGDNGAMADLAVARDWCVENLMTARLSPAS